MNDVIYCLTEIGGDPFYVGRSVAWHRRWHEHIRNAKDQNNIEVKYQHIRKLWAAGKDFEMLVLDDNPGKKYEKFYHYLLGCEYDLTNMRMGDSFKLEESITRSFKDQNAQFKNAQEFLDRLGLEIQEEKNRRKAAMVQARIRSKEACKTSDTSLTLIAGEKLSERFISPAMRDIINRRKNGNDRNKRQ